MPYKWGNYGLRPWSRDYRFTPPGQNVPCRGRRTPDSEAAQWRHVHMGDRTCCISTRAAVGVALGTAADHDRVVVPGVVRLEVSGVSIDDDPDRDDVPGYASKRV